MTLDRRVPAISIIEEARIRDSRFYNVNIPDGAILLYLNTKQRTLLLQLSDAIQPFISRSETITTTVSGAMVGFDGLNANTPYYITTTGTGYPIGFSAGTPYVDSTALPIAYDPFGVNGGTPGFPFPVDMIKLIAVQATFSDGTRTDVDVVPERSRNMNPAHNVSAFINGDRLVPIRIGLSPYQDHWTNVTSISASWVGMEYLHAIADKISLPTSMHEALIAGLVAFLASGCKELSAGERSAYQESAKQAEAMVLSIGRDMLGQITEHTVLYHD